MIIILGAGITGVSSAYYLSKKGDFDEAILIDKLPPLAFTTSCSGENFREYWPTRTDDNLPVIGLLDDGLYVSGSFAGYFRWRVVLQVS